jgi:hypothetical protein
MEPNTHKIADLLERDVVTVIDEKSGNQEKDWEKEFT